MKFKLIVMILLVIFVGDYALASTPTPEQQRKFLEAVRKKRLEIDQTGIKKAIDMADIKTTYHLVFENITEEELIQLRILLFTRLMPSHSEIEMGNRKLQSYLDNVGYHQVYWDYNLQKLAVRIKRFYWFEYNYSKFQIPYIPIRDNYIKKLEQIVTYLRDQDPHNRFFFANVPNVGNIGIRINSGHFASSGNQAIKWPIDLEWSIFAFQIGYYTLDDYSRINILHAESGENVEKYINGLYDQFLKTVGGE